MNGSKGVTLTAGNREFTSESSPLCDDLEYSVEKSIRRKKKGFLQIHVF
jgi:hypothetical protein